MKKINDIESVSIKGYTVGQLRELIKYLDDETPVVMVNPVNIGDNNHNAFEVGDVEIDGNGYASFNTKESPMYKKSTLYNTKGLLVYEN